MSNLDFDVDAAVSAFTQGAATRAAVAPTGSPERTAKALDLSARSGVPVPVIELDIEKAEQDIATQERAAAVSKSPALQTYVNSNPAAAQVSSDDYSALDSFLGEVQNFVAAPWDNAVETFQPDVPLGIEPGSETDQFFRDIYLFKDPNRLDPGTLITEPIIRSSVAAMDLIMRLGFAATAGAGQVFEQVIQAGNDATEPGFFGNPRAANRELQNFVNFLLTKTGHEPAHFMPEYPISNRTIAAGPKVGAKAAPEPTPLPTDPMQLQADMQLSKAEFDAAQLDAAVTAAVETRTRERAPSMIQELVQQNLGDRTVGVSAEALQRLYKEQGIVPGVGDPIMGFMPDIAQRLQVALATGADVEVPYASYLAYVDPKVNDALLPSIRSRGGMTIEEAKAAGEELQAAMEAKTPQFSFEETLQIGDYTYGYSGPVNSYLRGEGQTVFTPEALQDRIDNLDRLIEKSPVTSPLKLKRSVFGQEEQILSDLPIGETYSSPQFLSVTSREGLYSGTDVNAKEITINIPAEARALNVKDKSFYNTENEFILPRGTTLRKTGENEFEVVLPKKERAVDTAPQSGDGAIPTEPVGPVEAGITKIVDDLYLAPLADADALGMTKAEFAIYSSRLEEIQATARKADLALVERQAKRELTEEWRTTYGEELARAEEAFDARRDVAAARFIKEGTLEPGVGPAPPNPLDVNALGGVTLPKGFAVRGGVNPDEIAGLLGYQTGAELVADLGRLAAEQGRKSPERYRQEVTRGQANEAAKAKFGDLADRIEQVVALATSDDISRVLYDDLRVMQKQGGGEPLGYQEMKDWAHEQFVKEPVRSARKIKSWVQTVTRMGRKAELALLKGKIKDAFRAKNQQFMATLWMQEAIKFDRQLKKDVKLAQRYAKKPPRSVSPDVTAQIQKILGRIGLPIKADPGRLAMEPSLAEFVYIRNEGYGYDIAVSDLLTSDYPLPNWQDLPVGDFQDIINSIRSLDHVGRQEQSLFRLGRKEELAAVVNQAIDNIETLPLRFPAGERPGGFARWTEQAKHVKYWADALLVKLDRIFYDLDIRDPDGPLMQYIYHPMLKAEHFQDELFRQASEKVGHLRVKNPDELIPNDFLNPLTATETIRGVPRSISRLDLLHMALNYGNREGRRLLAQTLVPMERVAGADDLAFQLHQAFAEERVLNFINKHMREEDWTWVNGFWGLFKWMKPMEDQMYLRLSGVAPDLVPALEFETPFGTQVGGYAPIILDTLKSKISVAQERASFEASYYKATTANSYTKKRKTHFEPLLITNTAPLMGQKIRAALHDIAMREAVINAGKLIYDPKLRGAINKHYGPEYSGVMHDWLRYVANRFNEEDRMLKGLSSLMRGARKNLTVATLGFNLKTITTPQIGPFILELGMHPMQVSYMLAHWGKYQPFAIERSGELRSRLQNMDINVRDAMEEAIIMPSNVQRIRAKSAQYSLYLAAKIDATLGTVTWLRTYERQIAKGLNEEAAIQAADYEVVRYFGSASPVNLGAILRSSENSKQLLTLFYGYMNTSYNLTRDVVQSTRSTLRRIKKGDYAGARRDFAMVLADSFTVVLVPALFGIVYNPSLWDGEDILGSLVKLLLGHLAGTVPLLRDVVSATIQDLPVRQAPVANAITEAWRLAEGVYNSTINDEEVDGKMVRRAFNVPGLLWGLPTGQLGTSAQFFWNLTTNEDQADDLGSFIRGVTYGRSEVR